MTLTLTLSILSIFVNLSIEGQCFDGIDRETHHHLGHRRGQGEREWGRHRPRTPHRRLGLPRSGKPNIRYLL